MIMIIISSSSIISMCTYMSIEREIDVMLNVSIVVSVFIIISIITIAYYRPLRHIVGVQLSLRWFIVCMRMYIVSVILCIVLMVNLNIVYRLINHIVYSTHLHHM